MFPRSQSLRRLAVPTAALASLLTAAPLPAQASHPVPGPPSGSAQPLPRMPQPHVPDPGAEPAPEGVLPSPRAGEGDPRAAGARVYTGEGFDTCEAPPLATMRAWKRTSPFGAAGVYIGGRARGCPTQANLDADWVRATSAEGWRLIPVYVGSQAPCVLSAHKRKFALGHKDPAGHGAREGRDAVARAEALGMRPRTAIYLDMEAYRQSDARCAATTLRFVQAWNRAVRAAGYLPGFYSSADSGLVHMERARRSGARDLPEAVWFARWGSGSSVYDEKRLSPKAWHPHRRIHQYEGNVRLRYGGRALNVDRNAVDAPVAVVG